jgi:nicotinate phosphoribosyltransferase
MIIESLLDTDLYKFTMMQVILHHQPSVHAEYSFMCRNRASLAPFADEIQKEIEHLCTLSFTAQELNFLENQPFIKSDFISFLRNFRLNPRFITVRKKGKGLAIHISGPWLHTILFEVPVLAIVNEVYFRNTAGKGMRAKGRQVLAEKVRDLAGQVKKRKLEFRFADFGTRRRFSSEWQDEVDRTLRDRLPDMFVGTSNVFFAMKYGIRPIGTMAHEYLQAFQALTHPVLSQKLALETWVEEYRGQLGIALSDVITMDAFLRDFDLALAKEFDGCRHDSGDPFEWCNKLIAHYRKLGIDPLTKTAVFSDGLNFKRALDLTESFRHKINTSFGIGTSLTNDFGRGHRPLDIVIKMNRCNGLPVAKISDNPHKIICTSDVYINYLRECFSLPALPTRQA